MFKDRKLPLERMIKALYQNKVRDDAFVVTKKESYDNIIYSSSPDPCYDSFVGAYLGAEYCNVNKSWEVWNDVLIKRDSADSEKTSWHNLRCPKEQVWILEPKILLPLTPERHLKGERVGMRGFTYIDRPQIQRLLHDMHTAQNNWNTKLVTRTHIL